MFSYIQLELSKDRTPSISFRIVSGRSGLEEIASEWENITQAMEQKRRFFHLIDWYRCYLDALEEHPDQVIFCLIYSDNQPEAVIPLRKTSRRILGIKINVLELPNHPHLPLSDFIASGKDKSYSYLPRLFKELRQLTGLRWDYFYLPNVLEDASAIQAFTSSPLGLHVIKQQARHCNYLVVAPYEQLIQGLSSNFRDNLRKARNKLNRIGASYDSASRFPELANLYENFLEVEASGWKGEQGTGTAIKLDSKLTLFYQQLLHHYASQGATAIHVIKDKEKPISALFTLNTDDTLYVLKTAYDQAYAKLSPGQMLNEHILKNCFTEGKINHINLIGDAAWHNQWRPLKYQVFNLYIYGSTLRGRLVYVHQQLPKVMKSLMSFARKFSPHRS